MSLKPTRKEYCELYLSVKGRQKRWCVVGSKEDKWCVASGWWEFMHTQDAGRANIYRVSEAGSLALFEWIGKEEL